MVVYIETDIWNKELCEKFPSLGVRQSFVVSISHLNLLWYYLAKWNPTLQIWCMDGYLQKDIILCYISAKQHGYHAEIIQNSDLSNAKENAIWRYKSKWLEQMVFMGPSIGIPHFVFIRQKHGCDGQFLFLIDWNC